MSIKRTIIVTAAILASVAMVAPAFVGATTVSDLMAQIAALQSQLQGLSGTTTVATGTGLCAGVTFTRNLTVGATGSDVKCLQQILSVTPTSGYFGPKTLAAVKAYQTANGMTAANQVGPMTRAKLNASLGTTTGTTGTTPVVTPVGSVSAQLASDNPASGALIKSQATANLLNVNFAGTGTVTSVTLQRTGISNQNTLTNVYLFDGTTRLTDGYSFNVNGTLTINGLSIAVNGLHEISVKADVSSTATTDSSSVAIALTGFNGGSANVQGNTFQIVNGTAAGATLGGTISPVGTQTPSAGTTQYTVWSDQVSVTTRTVQLKGANFKMIGSAPSNALANIRLFVDGSDSGKVATVTTIQGSNYAIFDFTSAPLTMATGSHTVDVRADIVSGASRTVLVSLQQAADLVIYDPQVGVNIAAAGTPAAAGEIDIQVGSSTMSLSVNSLFMDMVKM